MPHTRASDAEPDGPKPLQAAIDAATARAEANSFNELIVPLANRRSPADAVAYHLIAQDRDLANMVIASRVVVRRRSIGIIRLERESECRAMRAALVLRERGLPGQPGVRVRRPLPVRSHRTRQSTGGS